MILDVLAHKLLLKVGGGINEIGPAGHFWPRDVKAALEADFNMWPVVINTNNPGVSTSILWFNPNGTTTTDAENSYGEWNLSLDGVNWINSPSEAQFLQWLRAYLGITTTIFTGAVYDLAPGATTPWIPIPGRGTTWTCYAGLKTATNPFPLTGPAPNLGLLEVQASQDGVNVDPTWNNNAGPQPKGIDGWGLNYGPHTHECKIKAIWEVGTGIVGRTSIVVNDNWQTVHAPNGTSHWRMRNTSPDATARLVVAQFG